MRPGSPTTRPRRPPLAIRVTPAGLLEWCGMERDATPALTVRLTEPVAFPYLLLLVSGGHCQLLIVDGVAGRQTQASLGI